MIPYTKLRTLPRVDLVAASPIPIPLNVFVEPTNVCNYKCSMCPESFEHFFDAQGGKHRLRWEDWESIAAKMEALSDQRPLFKTLNWYMLGEPLLNKLTTEFIADAHRRKLAEKMILTTNGTLIGKYAQKIVMSGLQYIRVSLYEEYKDDWGVIFDGLRLLRWNRGREESKTPYIYVKAFPSTPEVEQDIRWRFECVADELVTEQTMNWNGMTNGKRLGGEHEGPKECCPMPFYSLVIHSDLQCSVCCVDWNKVLRVGDLKKQSLKDVWNSEAMHSIRLLHLERKKHLLPGCKDCDHMHLKQDNLDALTVDQYKKNRMADEFLERKING